MWGTQPLADGGVYAYGAKLTAPRRSLAVVDERPELLRHFGTWHEPIPTLLARCDPATVLRHDVYAMKTALPAYHRGRAVLVGDAAHAMTPHLGQGGNQAIEDGVVIGLCLDAHGAALDAALATYTRHRLPRTWDVVRRSQRAGALAMASSPLATAARDALAMVVNRYAASLALRALDGIADWHPPAAYPAGADEAGRLG